MSDVRCQVFIILPVQFDDPEAEVPLVEHDDLVLVSAVIHHVPAGEGEGRGEAEKRGKAEGRAEVEGRGEVEG